MHAFARGQLQQGMQKLHLLSPPGKTQARVLLDQAQQRALAHRQTLGPCAAAEAILRLGEQVLVQGL